MEGICKDFPGVKALDNVSLTVRAGTVHALMGENGAGKSTLMKCLFGVYNKDSGHIYLEGKEINFKTSKEALENGVAMVHQELNQALKRNVMDNMWLGRFPKISKWCPLTSEKKMYDATKEVFEELEVHVDPKMVMSKMPVSQRQMVEIAKAVSFHSKVIVFDEPTSSLTEEEVEHLFRIINMLRDRGCGIIYISHKMEEILRISDDVTIMRDGQWVAMILFICMTLEGMILHHLNYQRHDSMYIFLIPLMYYLFNYLIEKSESSDKKIRNIATSIYIFHPLCIVAVRFMAGIIGLEKIFIKNNLILYITVCLGTLIFSILIERIKEVVINERKIKEQSMD